MTESTSTLKTASLTTVAMVAFAANSILCRAALGEQNIDAASFSTLRLTSGAVTLSLLLAMRSGVGSLRAGSWWSAALLFLYAVPFSFSYNSLPTGTGALILFGAVQATMLIAGLAFGERPHMLQWVGLSLAVGGLVYLLLPGVSAPSPMGSALMTVAGIAWGLYSLNGRGSADPLADTGSNFVRSVPMVALVSRRAGRSTRDHGCDRSAVGPHHRGRRRSPLHGGNDHRAPHAGVGPGARWGDARAAVSSETHEQLAVARPSTRHVRMAVTFFSRRQNVTTDIHQAGESGIEDHLNHRGSGDV